MKTLYLVNVVLLGIGAQCSGLAQASFRLVNYDSRAGLDAPVYDWSGRLLSGPEWRVELYGGTLPDSLSPVIGFRDNGRVIIPLVAPGYFCATCSAHESDLIARAVPGGGWAWLQVKVWDAQLGETYEAAAARGLGGYGQSALFYARGGDPTAAPPTLPGPLVGLKSFSVLQPIPEPSTGALQLLGGLGLCWAARRRKNKLPPEKHCCRDRTDYQRL